MTEVCIAALTGNRGAIHPQAAVGALRDVVARDRSPEARPSRTRVELRARVEKHRAAADARVQPVGVVGVQGTAEGTLGPLMAGDLVRSERELLAPFRICLHDPWH